VTVGVSAPFTVRVIASTQGTTPAWALAQPIGQWYTVPNTAQNLISEPLQPGISAGSWRYGPGYAPGRLSAWSGPSFRQKNAAFILGPTGGHGDYFMNFLTQTVLGVENPYVELLDSGSYWKDMKGHAWLAGFSAEGQSYGFTPEYKPFAYHSYWSLQFCDVRDWHIAMDVESHDARNTNYPWWEGYPFMSPPRDATFPAYLPVAGNTEHSMAFDYKERKWLPIGTIPDMPRKRPATESPTCTHGVTGDIWYAGTGASSGLWVWRQAESKIYKFGNNAPVYWTAVAIDTIRNRMFSCGNAVYDQNAPPGSPLRAQPQYGPGTFDLTTGAWTPITVTGPAADAVRYSTTNDGTKISAHHWVSGPQMLYSPEIDRFIFSVNGAIGNPNPAFREKNVLVLVNPTTWYCEYVPLPVLISSANNQLTNGIYTKLQVSSLLKGVVLMDRYDQGIKYCRLW
jgi:hypothetical protein